MGGHGRPGAAEEALPPHHEGGEGGGAGPLGGLLGDAPRAGLGRVGAVVAVQPAGVAPARLHLLPLRPLRLGQVLQAPRRRQAGERLRLALEMLRQPPPPARNQPS